MYQKLCEVIPGGVNSPARAFKGMEIPPLIVESGSGDLLTDIEGKQYIDYCGSWGALIFGHAHPEILAKVSQKMQKGTSFGLSSEIEEKLARKIVSLVSSVEKIRFVSSGTEATMSAVRLARGYTGRNAIIKFNGNYHGHADLFLVKAGSSVAPLPESSSAGVPKDAVKNTISIPYNDIEAFVKTMREWKNEIAAVIIEPIAGNMGVVAASLEFLEVLRKETEESGALLIFDEVITGFRLGLQGAQGLYRIMPDLTCFGKIIGGGFPAAAFGGSREIMNSLAPLGDVFQAGTLSGNPIAMEAGLQVLSMLEKLGLEKPGLYEELQKKTDRIVDKVRGTLAKKESNACIQQIGSMFTLFFGRKEVRNFEEALTCDVKEFARFFRFMISQGIFIPPSQYEAWFVSTAHTEEHLEYTADCILRFFHQ